MSNIWDDLDSLTVLPSEESPLQSAQPLPTDFWERHFLLSDLAQQAEQFGAEFSFQVHNHLTGETQHFDGVHLSTKNITVRH